jgi:predicted membrane channel-forming protein YqfA (hemolysin III family)
MCIYYLGHLLGIFLIICVLKETERHYGLQISSFIELGTRGLVRLISLASWLGKQTLNLIFFSF